MLNYIENIILLCVLISSINVLFVKNPVQSLLWLIMTFILVIMELLILGVEFIALLFLMVYIGAIAVLFLFVVMMLNVRIVELSYLYLKYLPIGIFVFLFFLMEVYFFVYREVDALFVDNSFLFYDWSILFFFKGNIFLLGNMIYTYFGIYFCILGIILFIAMIGSIVLILYLEKREKFMEIYRNTTFVKYLKF